jgi:hypothetical protein
MQVIAVWVFSASWSLIHTANKHLSKPFRRLWTETSKRVNFRLRDILLPALARRQKPCAPDRPRLIVGARRWSMMAPSSFCGLTVLPAVLKATTVSHADHALAPTSEIVPVQSAGTLARAALPQESKRMSLFTRRRRG